jgi:hypothetical protein
VNLHPIVVGLERPCRESELAAQDIGEESRRLVHVWYSHTYMICATDARRSIGHRRSASHQSKGCDSGGNYNAHRRPSLDIIIIIASRDYASGNIWQGNSTSINVATAASLRHIDCLPPAQL